MYTLRKYIYGGENWEIFSFISVNKLIPNLTIISQNGNYRYEEATEQFVR